MKKYDSYKDSGVEWIGKIPNHWDRIKVKHLVDGSKYYQIGDGDHGSIKPEMYQEDGIPYIRVQNLSWDGSLHKEGLVYLSEEVHSNNLKSKLIPGDFLVCKTGNTIGKIGVLTEEFGESNTTSSVGKISVDDRKYDRSFVKFSFQSEVLQKQIRETGEEKSCQPGFNNNQLTEFFLFRPPLHEQQQIVSFLDTKTSLIDSLIKKTQRKIELLKEKRTSLINELVTKGLNPNVEMKDSGVEWIGEIPSHWITPKLNYISNKITDGEHISPKFTVSGVPFLSSKDVRETGIDMNVDKFVSLEDSIKMRQRCNPEYGDVLVVGRGNSIGRISIVNSNEVFCLLGSVILLKHKKEKILNTYLFFYLQSPKVFEQLINTSSHSVQPTIYLEGIKNQIIILPPLSEQNEIVSYLDEQTGLIDKTISVEERRIELLKEYRQSLISEVVTGKIDLRTN